MQPFRPYLNGYYDAGNQLAEHIKGRIIQATAQEGLIKEGLKSVEEFEARRRRVKEAFLRALGGLPDGTHPLRARVTGVVERPHFRIEKVIFESLPGFPVTSNLYLPKDLDSPRPAVLFLCGHSREAKGYPVYQRVCQALVRAGFVVLAMDPLGQGERMQYVDPQTGQLVVNWGTTEHSHAGLQCTLTGANIARYFVHDAVRAVDYLCTRQEVDPNRIGVTGNSGGGTQTSYLLMVDQRIKVGVPCTYITSREHYLQTGQAHDAEQNLYGAVSEGINYDDFVTAIAPNPVMIGAVASDFFVIEGTLQSAKRARHVYQLYQRPENFRLVVAPGIHRYASLLRREAVKWFQYHLMGIGSQLEDVIVTDPLEHWETITSQRDFTEEQDEGFALEPLPDQELWCTESGQVYIDQPKAPKVFHFNREASQSAPPLTNPREVLRQAVLGERVRNPLWVRCLDSGREGDLEWHQVFFFTEPGIAVSGIWVTADAKAAPWLVLSEEGTEVLATNPAGIADLAREKGRLFLFDVRGIGAVKQRPINPRDYSGLYGTEFVLNYNAIMLKDSLVWMRAYDVLRALEYVQGVTGQSPSLVAYDWLGPIALAAVAAWDNTVAQMEYHRLLADLTSVIDTELHLCEHRLEAFDLARILDIPGLLAQYRDSVTVKSSVDGRGRLRTSAS